MRLYVTEHAFLQKPLHLSAVYRITSQAVNLPTNDALCLALLNPLEHFIEHWAAGHLCGAFFNKLLRDMEIVAVGNLAQFGKLRLAGENLLVLDIGAFAGVKKVFHS